MSTASLSRATMTPPDEREPRSLPATRPHRAARIIFAHLCVVASVIAVYVWARPLTGWSDGTLSIPRRWPCSRNLPGCSVRGN